MVISNFMLFYGRNLDRGNKKKYRKGKTLAMFLRFECKWRLSILKSHSFPTALEGMGVWSDIMKQNNSETRWNSNTRRKEPREWYE